MAKSKKAAPGKKSTAGKSAAKKPAAKKPAAGKTAAGKTAASTSAGARKPTAKKAPAKKKPAKPAKPARKETPLARKKEVVETATELSLGRPKVTQEEKLYLLFKEDYHARQIFDFLRVETVKELEQHSPQEILKRLSEPIRQTVERIRRKLAEKNRSLAGDEDFARQHRPD